MVIRLISIPGLANHIIDGASKVEFLNKLLEMVLSKGCLDIMNSKKTEKW